MAVNDRVSWLDRCFADKTFVGALGDQRPEPMPTNPRGRRFLLGWLEGSGDLFPGGLPSVFDNIGHRATICGYTKVGPSPVSFLSQQDYQ